MPGIHSQDETNLEQADLLPYPARRPGKEGLLHGGEEAETFVRLDAAVTWAPGSRVQVLGGRRGKRVAKEEGQPGIGNSLGVSAIQPSCRDPA